MSTRKSFQNQTDVPASFAAKLFGAFALGLAGLGLLASVAVFIAQGKVASRLKVIEDKTGRQISVGSIDVSLVDGIAIRDVRVTEPHKEDLHLVVDELKTDLDVFSVLAGKRRPEKVTIRGLQLHLRVDETGIRGFEDLSLKKPAAKTKKTEPRKDIQVNYSDVTLMVAFSHPLTIAQQLTLTDLEGTIKYASRSKLNVKGKGVLEVPGAQTPIKIEANTEKGGLINAVWDKVITFPVTLKKRRMLVGLKGFRRSKARGTTTLYGLTAELPEGRLSGNFRIQGPGGRMRPSLEHIKTVTVNDLKLEKGSTALAMRTVNLQLRKGKLRNPKELAAQGVTVRVPARDIKAQIEDMQLSFTPNAWRKWKEGRPLDALKSVKIGRPEARLPTMNRLLGKVPNPQAPATTQTAKAATHLLKQRGAAWIDRWRKQIVQRLASLELDISQGRLTVVDNKSRDILTLDKVAVKVAPSAKGRLKVGLDSRLVRKTKTTGDFSVQATLDPNGQLVRVTGFVRGSDVAHVLSGFSEYLSVERNSLLDMDFAYSAPTPTRPEHRLTGRVKVKQFGFEAWRISHLPIKGLEGELAFESSYQSEKRRLELVLPLIRIGKAKMRANMTFTRPLKRKPSLSVSLAMDRQDCADIARSIPPALIPRLKGLKMKGSMWFKSDFSVDMEKPKKLKLTVRGNVDACRIQSLGDQIRISDLQSKTFVHHPVEPKRGKLEHIKVGPGTDQWVSSRVLPRFVKAAAIVTEDRGFRSHEGVRWQLVTRALKLNLKKSRFVYGGSTITQQLVKNLYLTREKTLSRKLEEFIIAGQMERELTKDEILTLYVNVVEYGPNIYGVRKAAHFYFGKAPWKLSPLEAAFIMGLKPYPRGGYAQWQKQKLNRWWVKRMAFILYRMQKLERAISEAEYLAAAPYQPNFRPKGASIFGRPGYRKPVIPKGPNPTEEPL